MLGRVLIFENWEYWIELTDKIENLTDDEKQQAKNALVKIKRFFGLDVNTLIESGHPFGHYLINEVAETRRWFVYFIDAIETTLSQNGRSLVDKLRNKEKFYETLFELDIANRFIKAGFEVKFYPKIADKIPDLQIINPQTKEAFFVEISELGSSEQTKEALNTMDTISDVLTKNRLVNLANESLCLCKIQKTLSKPHLAEIIHSINKTFEKCENSGFEEFIDDGIKLAVAKEKNRNLLLEWGRQHNVRHLLEGPNDETNGIQRLKFKIQKEQEQLPHNYLNLVIIQDRTLFFWFGKSIEEKINQLSEKIYEFDHVFLCVILATYNGESEEIALNHSNNTYLHKHDIYRDRDLLLLFNRYLKGKTVTDNSLFKVKNAFIDIKFFLF